MSEKNNREIMSILVLFAKFIGSALCLITLIFIIYFMAATMLGERRSATRQREIEEELSKKETALSGFEQIKEPQPIK